MTPTVLQRVVDGITRYRILGKSPLGAYLRLNEWLWKRLPKSVATGPLLNGYGHLMHALVRQQDYRRQYLGTFFFRNRPELELLCRLVNLTGKSHAVRIAVVGCSNGAEVYTIMWALRSTQPAPKVTMHAVDISERVLQAAQEGVYSFGVSELVQEPVLERMTGDEISALFDREGDRLRIKPWIKEGITWHVGDAGDPRILDALGCQDVVVANRFLCHMDPVHAEGCLRNIARLVDGGGYLFVSGVDLDVRTTVAKDLGWEPIRDLMEEIHDGDRSLRRDWPWRYWGLEPFDRRRCDWSIRYASVFRLGEKV